MLFPGLLALLTIIDYGNKVSSNRCVIQVITYLVKQCGITLSNPLFTFAVECGIKMSLVGHRLL